MLDCSLLIRVQTPSHDIMVIFRLIPWERHWNLFFLQLWVKQCHCCSFTRMDLSLNNLWKFSPVGWSCRIHWLHLSRALRPPHPMRPPVGHGGDPWCLRTGFWWLCGNCLSDSGQITCCTPLWLLLGWPSSLTSPIRSITRWPSQLEALE